MRNRVPPTGGDGDHVEKRVDLGRRKRRVCSMTTDLVKHRLGR
jgi:hypothetical protein